MIILTLHIKRSQRFLSPFLLLSIRRELVHIITPSCSADGAGALKTNLQRKQQVESVFESLALGKSYREQTVSQSLYCLWATGVGLEYPSILVWEAFVILMWFFAKLTDQPISTAGGALINISLALTKLCSFLNNFLLLQTL